MSPLRHASDKRAMNRRGITLVYLTISITFVCGMVSLGVDFAHVQLAKTQLQAATDAAARYGASGLPNILMGISAARTNAVAAAADNMVDGTPLVLDPNNDVEYVIWNPTNKTYTVTSDPTLANAVRVNSHRTTARGDAVQLMFGRVLGAMACDINATSIAMLTPGADATYTVPATRNPFLAGMPAGSVASLNNPHNNPDYAGDSSNERQSPIQNGLTVVPGSSLTFDGVNGGATNDYTDSNRYTADGNLGWIANNTNGSENGISDMYAPGNSLVGVFLDDSQPNTSSAPPTLDFSSSTARDFTTLSPQLKQLFFIGDGRTSTDAVQQFVVPQGATRLFFATWDSYEWNNNIGSFSLTVHRPGVVTLVK